MCRASERVAQSGLSQRANRMGNLPNARLKSKHRSEHLGGRTRPSTHASGSVARACILGALNARQELALEGRGRQREEWQDKSACHECRKSLTQLAFSRACKSVVCRFPAISQCFQTAGMHNAETCFWQLLRRRGDESEHQELASCAQQWERKIKEVRQHVPRCLMLMKKSHGNPPTLAA